MRAGSLAGRGAKADYLGVPRVTHKGKPGQWAETLVHRLEASSRLLPDSS